MIVPDTNVLSERDRRDARALQDAANGTAF
jgi:hypothetical protein